MRIRCYDAAGAILGSVAGPLNGSAITTSWVQYSKIYGPDGSAFLTGTSSIVAELYMGFQSLQTSMAGGITFNEGVTPAGFDPVPKSDITYEATLDFSSAFISGTKPPTNADNTGSNTALNVVGQTAFATLAQINAANISTYIAGAAIDTAQIQNAAIGTLQIENNQTIFVPKLVAFNSAQHILQCYLANVTFTQDIPHTITTFSFANAMAQTSVMLNVRLNGNLQKNGKIINWRVTMLRKINSGAYVKIGNISNLSPPTGDYEFDVWFTDNPGAGTVSYAVGVELTGASDFQLLVGGNLTTNFAGQIVLMGGKR